MPTALATPTLWREWWNVVANVNAVEMSFHELTGCCWDPLVLMKHDPAASRV